MAEITTALDPIKQLVAHRHEGVKRFLHPLPFGRHAESFNERVARCVVPWTVPFDRAPGIARSVPTVLRAGAATGSAGGDCLFWFFFDFAMECLPVRGHSCRIA